MDWHFVSLWLFLSACPPRGGESWPCSLTEGWWRAQIVEGEAGGLGGQAAVRQTSTLLPSSSTYWWVEEPAASTRLQSRGHSRGEICTALRCWLQVIWSHMCRRQFKSFCNLLRGYTRCVGNTLRGKKHICCLSACVCWAGGVSQVGWGLLQRVDTWAV